MSMNWYIVLNSWAQCRCYRVSPPFISNNKTITNPAEVANEFNKYFVSIGQTLSRNVQSNRSYDEYLVENTNCQLIFNPVNEEMVAKIINQLKNKSSYGHDGISNILIKQ